jgi:hypothetical protein
MGGGRWVEDETRPDEHDIQIDILILCLLAVIVYFVRDML